MKKKRILALDASRGTAMLLVCVVHFTSIYFINTKKHLIDITILKQIGFQWSNSAHFMLISGILLGFLYHLNQDNFTRIKVKLIDRGLFLLLVAHLLINITHIPHTPSIKNAWRYTFITDTIGFSIIFGPLLIDRLRPKAMVFLGVLLYISSLLIAIQWYPHSGYFRILKEILFGTHGNSALCDYVPFIPWFGFYCVNSYIGVIIAKYFLENKYTKMIKLTFKIGIFCIIIGVFIKLLGVLFLKYNLLNDVALIHSLTNPFEQKPPSPAYFFFFSGIGYLITCALLMIERLSVAQQLMEITSTIGKTSLFVFVLQFYVYYVFCYYLSYPSTFSGVYIGFFSLVFISGMSHLWYVMDYNRFVTVIDNFKRIKMRFGYLYHLFL